MNPFNGSDYALGKHEGGPRGDTQDDVPTLEFCSEEHREAYRNRLKKQAGEPEPAQIAGTDNVEATEHRPQSQVQLHGSGDPTTNVRLVGLDVPIGDLVMFMLKWSVALIPAAIIISFVVFFILSILRKVSRDSISLFTKLKLL